MVSYYYCQLISLIILNRKIAFFAEKCVEITTKLEMFIIISLVIPNKYYIYLAAVK